MSDKYKKRIELYGDGIGRVEYVDHMGTDLTIVNSARVSFGKHKDVLDAKDEKLIKYLIKHRHTSTLEHNHVTFRFTVPMYVAAQHMRHRTWAYNSVSRRYTDIGIRFYTPTKFRTQHKSNRQASNIDELIDPPLHPEEADSFTCSEEMFRHHQASHALYTKLLEAGVCREQARGVLPQNLYTEYYGTVDASNLLKFIDLRTHEGAQWEIQKVALACLEIATDLWPVTVSSYREITGL